MLPGLNAAAVGLITAAVFQLSFSVRANSPTPVASTCIGAPARLQRPVFGDACPGTGSSESPGLQRAHSLLMHVCDDSKASQLTVA
jgi:hypothetical protein